MLRILIAVVIAYIGMVVMITLKQRSMMYFPMTFNRPDIAKAPWMRWVEVTTADGLALKSWFSPPEQGKPTLVFFHGNANSIEMRGNKSLPFVREGYGVLLVEYRGYGGNPGKPTEAGLYNDARAQLDWLMNEQGIKGQDLIFYGESLGSGVAVQMATEYEAKALVLDVPFSSAVDVAKSVFFFIPFLDVLMKDKYLSTDKIGNIHIPVLIGVGEKDIVVPAKFGKKLLAAANEPKTLKVYDDAGHMDIHTSGFDKAVVEFIETLKPNPAKE